MYVRMYVYIGVPSPQQRHEILLALLGEMKHSLSDQDIQNLAMGTHGFVGADLAALCNEAALVCLRQYVKSNISRVDSDFKISTVALDSVCQTSSESQDFCSRADVDSPQSSGESVDSNSEAASSCTSEAHDSSGLMDGTRVNGDCVLKDILRVAVGDFEKARVRVRPSAMREVNLPSLVVQHIFFEACFYSLYIFLLDNISHCCEVENLPLVSTMSIQDTSMW